MLREDTLANVSEVFLIDDTDKRAVWVFMKNNDKFVET